MARLGAATSTEDIPSGPAAGTETRPSIWTAMHPRLLELIHTHRSTLILVNSRRLAERLAGALNELAGETLVRSHHGSLARPQRTEVEDLLKAGRVAGLVATSSLELGIDMGTIDLVVQTEAPPTVANGLQRIGRAGHQIDAVSKGIIIPKFRGDLVACAAVTRAMREGAVEASHYPRNPLDIVAQHIVSMTAMDEWRVDELFHTVRRAAPFAELGRGAFEGVLDMLSGRYPSDEFAELRPRGAIANGGTIPDRGLYGVFLVGAPPGTGRVGELDEEMVFESSPGETFLLGASTWRIEDITHDRVLVSPAPGEPGKMPFWKGDRAGRPLDLGLAIGDLVHTLTRLPPPAALDRLTREHDLDTHAAENLLQYLRDQRAAGALPDARTVVVERVRDDLGDWRVCVLSPRGGRIHAPWAMAAVVKIREETGVDVETLWGDDGFVVRFPDVDTPPDPRLVLPDPDEVQSLVVRQLGATALFAAKFRENAGRSLLLPKRRPGMRAPLWQQRKRAADLLAVAARFGSFPVLLETYRECLRDVFDMPALVSTLRDIRSRTIRVATVDSDVPSPFAASLLFSYVASFLYDGDAPLAERRAQALSVDQAQLRELLGDAELRDLLDRDAAETLERQRQRLDAKYHVRTADGVHDLLLSLGDLDAADLARRTTGPDVAGSIRHLVQQRRALLVRISGRERFIAIEDAARYRDALGVPLPPGVPEALLEPVRDPLGDLVLRHARTHAPFTAAELAARFALSPAEAERTLRRLTADGRLIEGEFRPGGTRREWTDAGVLRQLRRQSLARLRHEVEPVDPTVLGRFASRWQGIVKKRRGADALLDVVEQLQGAPLVASLLETEILPARLDAYDAGDLDAVMAAGEVVWVGLEPLGDRDGRLSLFLADHVADLLPPTPASLPGEDERARGILDWLSGHGASFFQALHEGVGGGYPAQTVDALWTLVWNGRVTNDAMHALRAYTRTRTRPRRGRRKETTTFRSRRQAPAAAEGRWSLVPARREAGPRARRSKAVASVSDTRRLTATAQQWLSRHGILTRETAAAEVFPVGFSAVYPVLKALEENGRIRRGYFVAGLGATQFALPGAVDLLRSLRDGGAIAGEAVGEGAVSESAVGNDAAEVVVLSATDPANPYGATLKWPRSSVADVGRGPTRTVGATVVLVDGALVAYLARDDRILTTWLPDAEPQRTRAARSVANALIARARSGDEAPRGMLIEEIDGAPPGPHVLAPFLTEAGFISGALGFQPTYSRSTSPQSEVARHTSEVASHESTGHLAGARSPEAGRPLSRFARRSLRPPDRHEPGKG